MYTSSVNDTVGHGGIMDCGTRTRYVECVGSGGMVDSLDCGTKRIVGHWRMVDCGR